MNEYMQDPNYMYNSASDTGNRPSDIKSGLKYTNIILTILLLAVLAAGVAIIIVLAGIKNDVSKNTKAVTDISRDLSSVGDEVEDIRNTVDEILEQGCTGDNSANDPYYYNYPEYGVEKPVIYLYSDDGLTQAHVELELDGAEMTSMWPEAYVDGSFYSWDVSVTPEGILSDAGGNEYSYLFWEASDHGEHSFDKGFCVAGSDTAEFLKNTLSEIGLSAKESNEFIAYWLPRMQGNEYNLITFEGLDPTDAYNTHYRLSVRDDEGNEADSVLRVLMVWEALDEPVGIEAQGFDGFERSGFTVVEWGGIDLTSRN